MAIKDGIPSIRLLVVDDHDQMRQMLVRVIHRFGDMEVVSEAVNGREAVEAYEEYRPDITLMDIAMPEIHGLEATHIICRLFPAARIIIFSGLASVSYIQAAFAVGALACLGKDIELDQLAATIRAVHQGEHRKFVGQNMFSQPRMS